MTNEKYIVRFAPSPTGRLHIGHAYSALFTYRSGSQFILRIEDIDTIRCRPEFEQGIYEDLQWLGLEWPEPVRRQSEHLDDYQNALDKLYSLRVLYPCFCSRREINAEIENAGRAPHDIVKGLGGVLYPGTCRHLSDGERDTRKERGDPFALRLDVRAALDFVGKNLYWHDLSKGEQKATPEILGDVVLARKDISNSYHLAVTVDDHIQGITLVTRGEDLFHASHLHRLLQELLGLDVPQYHHHGLLFDDEGKRFAKRDNAVTLQHLREVEGKARADICELIKL